MQYLAKEIKRFGKQVFGKVLQQIEEKELAEEYPFGQAMSLPRHEIDDEISYRTIHRWAQEEM